MVVALCRLHRCGTAISPVVWAREVILSKKGEGHFEKKKKISCYFASTLLIAAVALTGCGGNKDAQQDQQANADGGEKDYNRVQPQPAS